MAGGGGGGGEGVITAGTGELLGVGDVPTATFTDVGAATGTGAGSGLALGGTGGPVALGGVPAVGNGETGGGGELGGHLALLRLVMAARHRHTASALDLQYRHASPATWLALGGVGGPVALGSISAVGDWPWGWAGRILGLTQACVGCMAETDCISTILVWQRGIVLLVTCRIVPRLTAVFRQDTCQGLLQGTCRLQHFLRANANS